jgi:succinyl-CoA synthetase beta subunit
MDQMERLYKLFCAVDATQVEINPFGLTPDGEVLCFDAKINFDDNAAYRQKTLFALSDPTEMDPRELAASHHNLNYIGMDGNIGCLVNGAGLAMATMDILNLHGGKPANFLDVGGGAQPNQIAAAYKLLLADENVQSIFVNIFGGIMRCDLIAEGILQAVKKGNKEGVLRTVPLVVRLAGTNDVMAREMLLKDYPNVVHVFTDLDKAAQEAVKCATLTEPVCY